MRPNIHSSSPRAELREVKQKITPGQRAAAKAGKERESRELLMAPVKATASRLGITVEPNVDEGAAALAAA